MSAPSPTVAREHYEAARAWARGTPEARGRPPGLAVLLRRGLPAWLAAWETWLPQQVGPPDQPGGDAVSPPESGTHALAVVLATMVEHCQRNGEDR